MPKEALPKLIVTISPTTKGDATYMQIITEDQVTVNIVLIAGEVEVRDRREGK